jgi:hypothetical protein
LIPKKFPLYSRLSSAFKWFSGLFSPSHPTAPSTPNKSATAGSTSAQENSCQHLNSSTLDEKERVSIFSNACPDCVCEQYRSSSFSPGIVEDSEQLTRFVFSPIHLNGKGTKIKPSVFSHISTKGCSIQRETIVSNTELVDFVTSYLRANPTHSWYGTLTANCKALRGIQLNGQAKRVLCVYDMAEEKNPSHGEIHQSQYVIEEADQPELRAEIFKLFNEGVHIQPKDYRGGLVLFGI